MKLISCTIENFGKLNNVTYDFSGENTSNEWLEPVSKEEYGKLK